MIVSTNTFDSIFNQLDDFEILLYDFECDSIQEHKILSLSYDDYMIYKEFNFDYIVIYDKNQRAFRNISEVSNENWNLLKTVYEFQKPTTDLVYETHEEKKLENLYQKKKKYKRNYIVSDEYKKLENEIDCLENYKYSTEFVNRKPILNLDDVVSTICKKLENFHNDSIREEEKEGTIESDEKISEEEIFFLKNNADAIFFIYSLEIEEEIELIVHRVNEFRKSSRYIDSIEKSNNRDYYNFLLKEFSKIDSAEYNSKFQKIREKFYSEKINKIVDNRRTRETYRLEILDNISNLGLIEFYELYHFYSLNKDSITSNFRQNRFTKKSKEIILRYLKAQNIENVEKEQYLKAYQQKILSIYKKKIISDKEKEELLYKDYEYIVNSSNKDYIIEDLVSINNNEKRSKGVYTKLIREFLFINLYALEYDYSNSYTSYKIEKLNLFKQQKKKTITIRTSAEVQSDLYEYVEELVWELEEQLEDEKSLLEFKFNIFKTVEDEFDISKLLDEEVFIFRPKTPYINKNLSSKELISIIKKIENSMIIDFYEYSQPFKIN